MKRALLTGITGQSLTEQAEAALLAFATLPAGHHPYIDFDEDRDLFWSHIEGLGALIVAGLVERGPLVWRADPVRAHARCLVLTDKGREALAVRSAA